MSDSIRIRSGDLDGRKEMPTLLHAEVRDGKKLGSEIAFRTDTQELYIGTEDGNLRLCGADDLSMIKELQATLLSLSDTIQDITARLALLEGSE